MWTDWMKLAIVPCLAVFVWWWHRRCKLCHGRGSFTALFLGDIVEIPCPRCSRRSQ